MNKSLILVIRLITYCMHLLWAWFWILSKHDFFFAKLKINNGTKVLNLKDFVNVAVHCPER